MSSCKDCPLIQYEIKNRLKLYGYEDIKNNPQYKQEILDEIISSCWCEKFGTKIWLTNNNGCDYEYTNKNKKELQHNNKRKLNKRESEIKHKKHLKQLSKLQWYSPPCMYMDEIWIRGIGYIDNPKPYYKRLYRGQRSKYLKKMSHKKVRRYKGELSKKGNSSNKLFDFWWKYD